LSRFSFGTHPEMSRPHGICNNGLPGGVLARKQRSVRGCDENAIANRRWRVCDENAAPNRSVASEVLCQEFNEKVASNDRVVTNQPKSQPCLVLNHGNSSLCRQTRVLECGNKVSAERVPSVQAMPKCEARCRGAVNLRAFRDITNTSMECFVSSDAADVASEFCKLSHNPEAKRRRQLPVSTSDGCTRCRLPSPVLVNILEMAGLKFERSECEYADANLKSDLQRESQNMPRSGFMSEQRSLNGRMRSILIDWIAQVLDMSRLSQRTFFLSVSLVDRCLSIMQVDRSNLQLLGSSAFLIAAKAEEIYPPEVANLVYICDGAYTKEQLLAMECTILEILDFRVDGPTVEHFLPHFIAASQSRSTLGPDLLSHGLASLWHFSAASDCDLCRNGVAWYLAELALLDNHMSQYPPSQVSASALYLANHLIKRASSGGVHIEVADVWDETLEHVSGYSEAMLVTCASDLDRLRTAALSDTLQQINRRHTIAVNATRHAIFQPSDHRSGSSPYAVVASAVPYPY